MYYFHREQKDGEHVRKKAELTSIPGAANTKASPSMTSPSFSIKLFTVPSAFNSILLIRELSLTSPPKDRI